MPERNRPGAVGAAPGRKANKDLADLPSYKAPGPPRQFPQIERTGAACPCCGQRMLVRHGVSLPPLLADLFDMVERAGKRGVCPEVLAWVFYPGKEESEARRNIYVNINRLNGLLVSTDIRVCVNGRFEPYRIVKQSDAREEADE